MILKMPGAKKQAPGAAALMSREQIAAQVVAVIKAHFSRPGPEEMKEILRCAEGQIEALMHSQLSPLS